MKKKIRSGVNALVLQILYRGFRVLYREDSRVRQEIAGWAEDLTLKLVCGPGGAVLAVKHDPANGVKKIPREQRADITMRFKSVEGAFCVLSGQLGIADAYARHLFFLEGDIYQTMSFVRCVEYLEAYLFPSIMTRRILKEIPPRELPALKVYGKVLLEGGK